MRKAEGPMQRGQFAKRASILDAAADVFCRQGFSGSSIDEIAVEAGVSRQTIYNHYCEKETLFIAVVEEVMRRADAMLFAVLSGFPDKPDDIEAELRAFSLSLNKNCLCNRDAKFLRRLIQNEGERYPHLFESWRKDGPGTLMNALAALFGRLSHSGVLDIDDFDVAARQFIALGNADLQMMIFFGQAPSDEQLESAARNAVRTFLKAYGTSKVPKQLLEAETR